MSKRTQIAYTRIFKNIQKHICPLEAKRFYTDYEAAMKNALSVCFPESELVSCWFRKKASKISELHHLIRTDKKAASIYYKFQALALLRCELICDAFPNLSKDAMKHDRQAFQPTKKGTLILFFTIYHQLCLKLFQT